MDLISTENYWNGLLIEYLKDDGKFLRLKKWNTLWGFSVPFKKFRVLPIGKIMRMPILNPNNFLSFDLFQLKKR